MAEPPTLTVKASPKGEAPKEIKVTARFKGRIQGVSVVHDYDFGDGVRGDGTRITFSVSEDVTADWRGHVLRGDPPDESKPYTDDFPVEVGGVGGRATVNMTPDDCNRNPYVLLFAPFVPPLKGAPPKAPTTGVRDSAHGEA
jgi:hypothetical protein